MTTFSYPRPINHFVMKGYHYLFAVDFLLPLLVCLPIETIFDVEGIYYVCSTNPDASLYLRG